MVRRRKVPVPSFTKRISSEVGISEEAVSIIRSLWFNKVFTDSLLGNINYMVEVVDKHKRTLKVNEEILAFLENAELERINAVLVPFTKK